jgi:hypothetical protein
VASFLLILVADDGIKLSKCIRWVRLFLKLLDWHKIGKILIK